MKKKINTCLLALVAVISVNAQADTLFRFVKAVKGDIAAFAVDNLDNIYLLSSGNQLKKLNANGDSTAIYNDVKKFGQVTLIDVSNPLRVLLYYKDFATIVVLDRFLTIRNTIDLRKYNILQVRAIGQSYDNKIWVYDELENKLKKIDEDGKLLQETPDFRQLFDPVPAPQLIVDHDQFVYLYDSAQAVFVFDYYGTFKSKIAVSHWQNLKIVGSFIFGSGYGNLFRYDMKTLRLETWQMPSEIINARSFSFSASRLYALRKDSIDIFSFR